ncbi:MAG: leucyl/phenylalanyl-tRNA--protein transferase [Xanthomonadaceae bacterium]|nr:leucyl/phenylalanyl-tRNA--protein transferase [Xanthomonadaceae bacterium]
MSLTLPWLDADPAAPFPPPENALSEPAGLLAAGGDLSPTRLLNAYRHGIFPWFSEGQPLLWWCPDPRMVFRSDGVHLSTRFNRQLRDSRWTARADTSFDAVIAACAHTPRAGQRGTWITDSMQSAYGELHRIGHAHSVEIFEDDRLVGGIYGVAIGRMFFGESMFSGKPGGSKAALAALARGLHAWGWPLIDAQVDSPHLRRLGAESWPRQRFLQSVRQLTDIADVPGAWSDRFGTVSMAVLAA